MKLLLLILVFFVNQLSLLVYSQHPDNLNVTGTLSTGGNYIANKLITSDAKIATSEYIHYATYERIIFNVGFQANAGSYFKAEILSSPSIDKVVGPSNTALYEKFESVINISNFSKNPFDPGLINVYAIFTSPTGKMYTVDGFYYTDFDFNEASVCACYPDGGQNLANNIYETRELKSLGSDWRVRFAPNEVGTWSYKIYCRTDGTYVEEYSGNPLRFNCTTSSSHGFIQISNNKKFLKYQDGTPLFLIGENMQNGLNEQPNSLTPICRYVGFYKELSQNGGNYVRHCQQLLKDNNLTSYNMENAYRLDKLFDYASYYGLKIKLNITSWVTIDICNPLDSNIKKFLKYLIARYSYANNLIAWEIKDEYDNKALTCNQNALNWFTSVKQTIKEFDKYNHLISSGGNWYNYQNDTYGRQMLGDFIEIHYSVGVNNVPAPFNNLCDVPQYFTSDYGGVDLFSQLNNLSNVTQKPIYINSFWHTDGGYNWGGVNSTSKIDPHGFMVHNSMWLSLFSNHMAIASPYYHDCTMHPSTYYPGLLGQYKAISQFTQFFNFANSYNSIFWEGPILRAAFLANSDKTEYLGWVQDNNYKYRNLFINYCKYLTDITTSKPIIASGEKISFNVNSGDNYMITWYNINVDNISYLDYDMMNGVASNGLYKVEFTVPGLSGIYGDLAFVLNKTRLKNENVGNKIDSSILINKSKRNEIFIYPNPTNRFVQIGTGGKSDFRVTLLTSQGKILFSGHGLNKIDLNNYPAGVYLIKIEMDNSERLQKIIKF